MCGQWLLPSTIPFLTTPHLLSDSCSYPRLTVPHLCIHTTPHPLSNSSTHHRVTTTHLIWRPARSGAASRTTRPFQQHATGIGRPASSSCAEAVSCKNGGLLVAARPPASLTTHVSYSCGDVAACISMSPITKTECTIRMSSLAKLGIFIRTGCLLPPLHQVLVKDLFSGVSFKAAYSIC